MEEFPTKKVHLQPATRLPGEVSQQTFVETLLDINGQFGCGHRAKFSSSVREGGGGIRKVIGVVKGSF